jgi:hypothetical protein
MPIILSLLLLLLTNLQLVKRFNMFSCKPLSNSGSSSSYLLQQTVVLLLHSIRDDDISIISSKPIVDHQSSSSSSSSCNHTTTPADLRLPWSTSTQVVLTGLMIPITQELCSHSSSCCCCTWMIRARSFGLQSDAVQLPHMLLLDSRSSSPRKQLLEGRTKSHIYCT